ncbi:MAG: deoxyribose-phosphate aldolase [Planctomycetota bacterium]
MQQAPHTRLELARLIDHTLLRPEATRAAIDRLCEECLEHRFFAACVNPIWVGRCTNRLIGSETVVAGVVGFPLGATTSETKAYEALAAVEDGAREIDMVINLGALLSGEDAAVRRDIAAVVETVKHADPYALVKVIVETALLTEEQIAAACRAALEAEADFVKTSTGFHPGGGATVRHVACLRQHAGPLKVKAAGGIRDWPTARAMLEAGADRLGLSASVAVLSGLEE